MTESTLVAPKLLVLGGPASGKTTYRTQLYLRIQHESGELQLHQSVEDLGALDGDVERIVAGLQPMHTNADVYHVSKFSVKDSNKRILQLEFADYGGEQLGHIGNSNEVSADWIERASTSACWLFFVRADDLRQTKSFMSDPVESSQKAEIKASSSQSKQNLSVAEGKVPSPDAGNALSVQTELSPELISIESLQRLLFVRGTSLRYPLDSPRLGVLLSCWDELSEEERQMLPKEVLATRAPLLSAFLQSNWQPSELRIWGLSSTGKKLPEKVPDHDFAVRGPTNSGYLVTDEEKDNPDLTIPISWLMRGT